MAAIISGGTAAEAWLQGASLVLQTPGHVIRNLVTEINNPVVEHTDWYERFDPIAVGAADRMSVVAKVLFPALPRRLGEARRDYYRRCTSLLERALKSRKLRSSWGATYFQRLVSMDGSENQIERAIRVLNNWQVRGEAAIVAHTSNPRIDGLRKRGSPCLQYIELLWGADETLDLVAVYRNHDFLNKTLGNFIGLGRLLNFVASESSKTPGRVICHSVRAYTDQVGKLRALAAR